MVSTDGVAYLRFLLVLLGEFHTENCMWELRILIRNLSDVMEESGTFCNLRIEPEFGGHCRTDIGNLAGVLEKVLTI